jgi:YgiT-type zinc finger domain-containing protein
MKCVVCKSGETQPGTTTVTFEQQGLPLVMKEVPAQICLNFGDDYIDEKVAQDIMVLAEKMSQSGARFDVRKYVPGSVSC